ncbi:MAG: fatty acid desaturase [Deltaproteobacteria bacterium]|nr:fatty acid desaturase [Deltaproteobacteria bacterium]
MFRGVDVIPASVIAAGTALAAVPFAVELSAGTLAFLWLVSTVMRSIAPVHQHCHAHYAVFRNPPLDAAYDTVLMLAAGNTTAVWELQHVRGHHQSYLERVDDPANNHRFGESRLVFTVLGDAMSTLDSWRISRGYPRQRVRLVYQSLVQLGALACAFAIDARLALLFVVVPWLLLRWAVFWFSYAQHDDVPMQDVYSGSVTHFGLTNRFYLNVGHHTAHHEKPTLHWSLLPVRTAQILERIPPACLR